MLSFCTKSPKLNVDISAFKTPAMHPFFIEREGERGEGVARVDF